MKLYDNYGTEYSNRENRLNKTVEINPIFYKTVARNTGDSLVVVAEASWVA